MTAENAGAAHAHAASTLDLKERISKRTRNTISTKQNFEQRTRTPARKESEVWRVMGQMFPKVRGSGTSRRAFWRTRARSC